MTGSSWLKVLHKTLCQRDERKTCYIFFLKLRAKKKANFSKIIGERVTFMWRVYSCPELTK